MITRYFRTLKDSAMKELSETRSGVWIHAVSPTEEELTALFAELALDEALVEDALDFYEVPRYERSSGANFFFTRYPCTEKQDDTETAPIMIVVGESFVMTVVQREIPQLRKMIEGQTPIVTTQKTKLFIQILQEIVHSFERELVKLRRAVHRDRAKLRKIGSKEIVRFVNYEHKLNDIVASVLPTNAALQKLMQGKAMQMYSDDVELMDDLVIDNSQLIDSSRAVLKTIQNVRSGAEAILSNTLNNRIKTLTVLTIILTIPTIFTSLYGMNVPIPLAESDQSFWIVLGVIAVTVVGVLFIFRKNEWI